MPSGHRCASQTSIPPAIPDTPWGLRYISLLFDAFRLLRCTSQNSVHFSTIFQWKNGRGVHRASQSAASFLRCTEVRKIRRACRVTPQFPRRTKAPQCSEVSKAHRSPVPRRGFQAHRVRMVYRVFHEQTFPIANARHEGHPRRFDMPKTLRWSNGNAGRAARPVRFGPRLPACPASSAHQVTRSEPAPARDALTTCRAPRPRGPRDPRAP